MPKFFKILEAKLLKGEPVPNKLDQNGALSSDTTTQNTRIREKVFPKRTPPLKIGSNANMPYLDRLSLIMAYRYKTIILIRNPAYTLGSWRSQKTARFSEAHVTDDDLDPRWHKISFSSSNPLERQAQIWEHYARLVYAHRHCCLVVRYEDLTDNPHSTFECIFDYLGIRDRPEMPELRNYNLDSRYQKMKPYKTLFANYVLPVNWLGMDMIRPKVTMPWEALLERSKVV